mmetsp:Transcript_2970/g.8646  ORF Transcript_2970/g.8646 Transcript_2970/m.8646 type:complete len:311 (-) Transcript_2970:255-1187(-)
MWARPSGPYGPWPSCSCATSCPSPTCWCRCATRDGGPRCRTPRACRAPPGTRLRSRSSRRWCCPPCSFTRWWRWPWRCWAGRARRAAPSSTSGALRSSASPCSPSCPPSSTRPSRAWSTCSLILCGPLALPPAPPPQRACPRLWHLRRGSTSPRRWRQAPCPGACPTATAPRRKHSSSGTPAVATSMTKAVAVGQTSRPEDQWQRWTIQANTNEVLWVHLRSRFRGASEREREQLRGADSGRVRELRQSSSAHPRRVPWVPGGGRGRRCPARDGARPRRRGTCCVLRRRRRGPYPAMRPATPLPVASDWE